MNININKSFFAGLSNAVVAGSKLAAKQAKDMTVVGSGLVAAKSAVAAVEGMEFATTKMALATSMMEKRLQKMAAEVAARNNRIA